jgi:hypothetical protein
MPALTLIVARETLWNSASNQPLNSTADEKSAVDAKINQAIERILTLSRPRGSLLAAQFTVYDYQVTLPRNMSNVLGWKMIATDGTEQLGGYRNIYNRWFQYANRPPPDCGCSMIGLYDAGDGFVIFRSLPTAGKIKLYTSRTEAADNFHVRGLSGTAKVFTGTGTSTIEGENLIIPTASGGSVTSATTFDAGDSLYEIVKPTTNGVLTLYHVNATTGVETLIGRYDPGETIPNYRRYTYPNANSDNTSIIEVISDEGYVAARADNDQLAVSNLGALKNAMKALGFEDANDEDRYNSYIAQAQNLIDNERQKFDGDSAIGVFQNIGDYGAGSVVNTM